jgi:long-chain acyl-CoA synthetase
LPATLAEIWPAAALRHGARTAVVVEDRRLSFTELDALADGVALGLAALGVVPGDRVALFGANSPEWVVAYHGAARTGAVLNPLSSMLTSDELRYTVSDAGARVVIGAPDKLGQLLELKAEGLIEHVVVWGIAEAAGAIPLADWLGRDAGGFGIRPRDPSDLAVIAYTSGTTGRPKGAMQSHRAVVAAAAGTALMAGRTAEDRVVSALPLFWP